ncbi:MAG: ATP-dependent DNA helicase UvrD2 [Actinomycetia bacterium]|nr:ATP-dependent DNA helicase UvrD2 [Actinomycetes bacterium]
MTLLLNQLNPEQQAAAAATSGPVVIHAGAGTGKTRVITYRAAYASQTGAMDPATALMLTFTRKAADEMRARLAALGTPQIQAATFHAAARRQLDYFWPQIHGERLAVLDNAWSLVSPLVRRLPGHYKFTPTQDVLDAISWAQTRRIDPVRLQGAATAAGRTLPLPEDLLRRVMSDYQATKRRRQVVDFDDMVILMTDLLRENAEVAQRVRDRYQWFCVDEYQDTNPANDELLREWVGPRNDICVVGDAEQTIYSFAGASQQYLLDFTRTWPSAKVFHLSRNYRCTPAILTLANRLAQSATPLVAAAQDSPQLQEGEASQPEPILREVSGSQAELNVLVDQVQAWLSDGVRPEEIAVLVRLNADLVPIEAALAKAAIPYRVKGAAFYERPTVRKALGLLTAQSAPADAAITPWFERQLSKSFGFDPDAEPTTNQAREEQAILQALLDLVRYLAGECDRKGEAPVGAAITAELASRAKQEQVGTGVELATLHRAKGLEWDAVFLPMLEEGRLPVSQSAKRPELLAEERRLLYVGITRARRYLVLTWARERAGGGKASGPRKPSRFLAELTKLAQDQARSAPSDTSAARKRRRSSRSTRTAAKVASPDKPLYEALKAWRLEEARERELPAYVIFHDRALADFATNRPESEADLLRTPGVGPAKVTSYGAAVLAVIASTGTAAAP